MFGDAHMRFVGPIVSVCGELRDAEVTSASRNSMEKANATAWSSKEKGCLNGSVSLGGSVSPELLDTSEN